MEPQEKALQALDKISAIENKRAEIEEKRLAYQADILSKAEKQREREFELAKRDYDFRDQQTHHYNKRWWVVTGITIIFASLFFKISVGYINNPDTRGLGITILSTGISLVIGWVSGYSIGRKSPSR